MAVTTDKYLVDKAMGPYNEDPFYFDDPEEIDKVSQKDLESEDEDFELPF